ncbi:hypothetical protein EVAR_82471_1 [Eumeta japonica]|uniref:Uncharacterized protein n=1 Tax=Eumeta variegata TaxID=151549 RepID=A0A4C1X828_EUMVA|nr:hypothetical protein EVAR_82471_1 [Eumeta japonica]
MTYASPVFAHAASKALHRLQDASKRFFDIAGSHPNRCAAVDYQPPHPTTIRRPRNVLTDPPDALTAAMTSTTRMTDLEKEPTRDGFLRHPMPRRLPGVVHSACHAPSALACAVCLGEAIKVV